MYDIILTCVFLSLNFYILFEGKYENQKMALKDKLHDTKMGKEESVYSYLTWVAQVKDELAAVGEVISNS
jgi:hypothetical protein